MVNTHNFKAGQRRIASLSAVALAFALAMPNAANAVSVDIFLIADHTTPASGTSGPFSVTTNTVYQLSDLNSGFRARQATLVNNFSFNIDNALSFAALDDPSAGPSSGAPGAAFLTDQNEIGAGTAAYVNSEISTWDNAGIPGSTIASNEQLDFGRNSLVTFNPVAGGFTDLVLTDLGGLNPFDLRICSDVLCTTEERIFSGFNRGLQDDLVANSSFAASDTGVASETDQTWLFRFHNTVTDFLRITEFDDRSVFTGARLQLDFAGTGGGSTITPVPGPAGLPLFASGLGLLAFSLRRKKL